MDHRSYTGGVMPAGPDRIQFDLRINGRRLRPSLRWEPTEENLERAREHRKMLKARILAGTFRLAEEFPEYVRRHTKELPLALIFCDEVFDAFLHMRRRALSAGTLRPRRSTRIGRSSITPGDLRSAVGRYFRCDTRSCSGSPIHKRGRRRPTTTRSARYVERSRSASRIIPRRAIRQRCCGVPASARRTALSSIPSVFKMPKH